MPPPDAAAPTTSERAEPDRQTPDATAPGIDHLIRGLKPGRKPWGCAAVLLPHREDGTVDWSSFTSLLERTRSSGLTPAVNMDTGFVQLLDPSTRQRVLDTTSEVAGPGFLAGSFVSDGPGDPFAPKRYLTEMEAVTEAGGTPVVFPSHGLNALGPSAWVGAHHELARGCDRFVAFELGPMFVPHGRIYPLAAYRDLLGVDACVGAKHSSLSRRTEWERLAARDALRPDFAVLTGNDLAIDMICHGSDYLLGLASFCPDAFARRDEMWERGDPAFYELNDLIQHLGSFSFRHPVPAYRHDAAMFLHHRGWIRSPGLPRGTAHRPASDLGILALIDADLERFT